MENRHGILDADSEKARKAFEEKGGRDWSDVRCDEFIAMLDEFLTWFCQERIKERLGFMSPRDYLISAKSVQL